MSYHSVTAESYVWREDLTMKNARTSWKLAVLLLLVLVKESAWIMWIPAGASPVEIAHYRIAEIRGTKQGSEMRGLPAIRKELVEIERYALIGDNGLPIRGSDDRARLDGVLSRDDRHACIQFRLCCIYRY